MNKHVAYLKRLYLFGDPMANEVAQRIMALEEALRDVMCRICIDTEEDAKEVAEQLGIEDAGSLWESFKSARDVLDDVSYASAQRDGDRTE